MQNLYADIKLSKCFRRSELLQSHRHFKRHLSATRRVFTSNSLYYRYIRPACCQYILKNGLISSNILYVFTVKIRKTAKTGICIRVSSFIWLDCYPLHYPSQCNIQPKVWLRPLHGIGPRNWGLLYVVELSYTYLQP